MNALSTGPAGGQSKDVSSSDSDDFPLGILPGQSQEKYWAHFRRTEEDKSKKRLHRWRAIYNIENHLYDDHDQELAEVAAFRNVSLAEVFALNTWWKRSKKKYII